MKWSKINIAANQTLPVVMDMKKDCNFMTLRHRAHGCTLDHVKGLHTHFTDNLCSLCWHLSKLWLSSEPTFRPRDQRRTNQIIQIVSAKSFIWSKVLRSSVYHKLVIVFDSLWTGKGLDWRQHSIRTLERGNPSNSYCVFRDLSYELIYDHVLNYVKL